MTNNKSTTSVVEKPQTHISAQHRLWCAFALGCFYIVLLALGGLVSGSLTLMADSAHMLGHSSALLIALIASLVASSLAKSDYSVSYQRIETIGGVLNGVLLMVVALGIGIEAYDRLIDGAQHVGGHHDGHAHQIDTDIMSVIAILGLGLHAVSAWVLHGGRKESLNVYALYLHIMFDVMATVISLLTSVIIHFTALQYIDNYASILVAVIIFYSASRILKRSVRYLFFARKTELESGKVSKTILSLAHVKDVHNVIIHPKQCGGAELSAHVVLKGDCVDKKHWETCRTKIEEKLKEKFHVHSIVLQFETEKEHIHD